MKAIWITWENQRRNRSMSEQAQAQLHELSYPGKNRLLRYLKLGLETLKIIAREKPSVVFYQNPSIALAAIITAYKKMTAQPFRLVGDFHNAGVFPPVAQGLAKWIARNADLVIVTNSQLQTVVESWGAKSIAIPDPIPDLAGHAATEQAPSPYRKVLFICSWAEDEPIAEVFRAAHSLLQSGQPLEIRITGRPKLQRFVPDGVVPANVKLTGYLSDEDFERELHETDAILDLTTRDNCMVCGAYEGVAVEKPLILSGNQATREYFNKGVLFTDNTAIDIAERLIELITHHDELSRQIIQLKKELQQKQQAVFRTLQAILAKNTGQAEEPSAP